MSPNELKSSILKSRNPGHWQFIIGEVEADLTLFPYLVQYSFSKEEVLAFRSSWIMDKTAERNPDVATSSDAVTSLIQKTPFETNYSVIRACLRMLTRYELQINDCGELVNSCFEWLSALNTPIAVKVHAMQLLYKFTIQEPALKNELSIIIEEQMPVGSAGFKARGKRILKQLEVIR